jgi:hypothetical protein
MRQNMTIETLGKSAWVASLGNFLEGFPDLHPFGGLDA